VISRIIKTTHNAVMTISRIFDTCILHKSAVDPRNVLNVRVQYTSCVYSQRPARKRSRLYYIYKHTCFTAQQHTNRTTKRGPPLWYIP
jgi:hypothetical protein